MINITKQRCLEASCTHHYTSSLYICNEYIFLQPDCKRLIKVKCNSTNTIELEHPYISLTKDNTGYYASTTNCIYKLDINYNAIATIPFNLSNNELINSITYTKNTLIIGTQFNIYCLDLNNYSYKSLLSKELICKFKQCNNYITNISYFCCKLLIAYNIDCKSYIAELGNYSLINNSYIGCNIIINSSFNVNNQLKLLVNKTNGCSYIYDTNIYCKVNNSYSVIESIALVEASISHILNAEGEKLQKAIAISTDICELLKINDSVNDTINNIIELEQVLCKKLQIEKNCDK